MSFADQTGTNSQQTQAEPQVNEQQTSPFLVVGERAFTSQEDVAKKIQHADSHIQTIEQQNAAYLQQIEELQRKVQEASKIDDVLAKVGQPQQGETPAQKPSATVDPNELVSQVLNTLDSRNQEQQKKANLAEMESLAKQHYGDTMETSMTKIASELGMDMKSVDELASTNPKAFKQLFIKGDKVASKDSSFTGSDVSSAVAQQQAQPKRQSLLNMPKAKDRAALIQARMAQYIQNQS